MFHGILKTIDDSLREALLDHQAFYSDDSSLHNFIDPKTDYDRLILKVLDTIEYDYSGKKIEYWFQNKRPGDLLHPHFDYNYELVDYANPPTTESGKLELMSPVTIVVYLEVSDDLVGGDLCISDIDWTTMKNPFLESKAIDMEMECQRLRPVQGQILAFEGSRYFHWIDKVERGYRKSLLINFWPTT